MDVVIDSHVEPKQSPAMTRPESSRSIRVAAVRNRGHYASPSVMSDGPPSPTLSESTHTTQASNVFGPDQGPRVVVTRADLKQSLGSYESLLGSAKAYRNALLALASATAGFATALEDCARQKGAGGYDDLPGDSPSERLMAAAGLHHVAGNHTQILADCLYKNFEIPLLEQLDEHRNAVAERQSTYEKQVQEKTRAIRETEATNMQHGRKKMRDLNAFRRALTTLQTQVDDLDRLKCAISYLIEMVTSSKRVRFAYYSELLDGQAETFDLIAQKAAVVVTSQHQLYDRVASKATSDPILETMVQSVLDPFGEFERPEDANSDSSRIFSILPPMAAMIPPAGLARVASPPPGRGPHHSNATPIASRFRPPMLPESPGQPWNSSPSTPRHFQRETSADDTAASDATLSASQDHHLPQENGHQRSPTPSEQGPHVSYLEPRQMALTPKKASATGSDNHTAPPTPLQHDPRAERPLVVGDGKVEPPYPIRAHGVVTKGFGRGSKELGCPTANLPDDAITPLANRLDTGVHFGFARVGFSTEEGLEPGPHDKVLPMVMSVGWNPYYKNERRTAEVHILHDFPHDFYGHEMWIVVLGFIRPEYNYTSREALVEDIETDKLVARRSLAHLEYQRFHTDAFFRPPPLSNLESSR